MLQSLLLINNLPLIRQRVVPLPASGFLSTKEKYLAREERKSTSHIVLSMTEFNAPTAAAALHHLPLPQTESPFSFQPETSLQ